MSSSLQDNNKRIAKNTMMLYFRMLITLFVGLYTSRIVLQTLGISDYGLYNVVGGFVSMLAFINNTMATGTQRFLSFEIGTGNVTKLQKVFSNALIMHIGIALIIFVLAETIGLWFLNNKMNIPDGRHDAAFWVFQFSVFTMLVSVIQVPFMSSLIAHEKMDVYAYMSIYDVTMKLLIVYLLQISDTDKLVLYAILMFLVQASAALLYNIYCQCHYVECRWRLHLDKSIMKEMVQFSGWTVVGIVAGTTNGQGINIILNMFCGTIVNAARGIAFQINNILIGFTRNFQVAANPQIIKLFAEGKIKEMTDLAIQSSKISAFLLLFIMLPIFIDIEFVLYVWLGEYPAETPVFLRIILIQSLIQSMSYPVIIVTHASGYLKMPNLTAGISILVSLPISYFILILGGTPVMVFLINLVPWIFEGYFDSYYAQKYTGFSQYRFYKEVYLRVFVVTIMCFSVPILLSQILPFGGWMRFICLGLVCLSTSSVIIYFRGFDRLMREQIRNIIFRKFHIIKKIRI